MNTVTEWMMRSNFDKKLTNTGWRNQAIEIGKISLKTGGVRSHGVEKLYIKLNSTIDANETTMH